MLIQFISCFFFFNDTATTEIYTLSLHDALPISPTTLTLTRKRKTCSASPSFGFIFSGDQTRDRKSTRLNSSHGYISYAVFCLKKKNRDNDDPAYTLHRHSYRTTSPSHCTVHLWL